MYCAFLKGEQDMDVRVYKIKEVLKNPPVARFLMNSNAEEAVLYLRKNYDLDFTTEEWIEIKQDVLSGEIRPYKVSSSTIKSRSLRYRTGYFAGKICKLAIFLALIIVLLKFVLK